MITIDDMKTHLYQELIDVISRNDTTLLEAAIETAETEAKGYMSRYNIDTIFAQTGSDRDFTLVTYLKDMVTWHFIVVANPNTDLEYREVRYNHAIAWLKGIQKGQIVPPNWPPAEPEEQSTFFHFTSAPKRETRY